MMHSLDVTRSQLPTQRAHLGIAEIRLITNNPDKVRAMRAAGIHLVDRIPATSEPSLASVRYLHTKRARMGHMLDIESLGRTAFRAA